MFEYSKILSERKLKKEDVANYTNDEYKLRSSVSCDVIPEFSHVEIGDSVIKIIEVSQQKIVAEIFADVSGFVRYPLWGVKMKFGETLFYITDNDNALSDNWDKSNIRIESDVLDGKYYYSLKGLPKKAIVDNGRVLCDIRVINDDPIWKISCELVSQDINRRSILFVKIEQPFSVKLKNGRSIGDGVKINYISEWDDEGDGEHLCVRNFAIGYPKKSQIRQDIQPTPTTANAEEACFVYIMRNNDNGAYKIGISKNPEYREHTLQSQEPNVTCIFQLEFESRERARAVEGDMHIKYAEFHIRGEWFAIPHERVSEVMADIVKYK